MRGIRATRPSTAAILSSLLTDIGSHLRYLDPAGKHVEYWAHDDGFISDERWRAIHAVACSANPEVIGTVTLLGVTGLIGDMLAAVVELESEEK